MVATSDILALVSLIMATILGLGAIWATRRYNNSTRRTTDTEMGLLHNPAPTPTDEDEAGLSAQTLIHGASERRSNLHEVIGEALEVFSKHLRAYN
ncbi:hypothetical protein N431DRAFT_69733 [Stipitochalara longipes BDJ]|nr:hypothetical protein N431DRAFT_69733 [Stipitochalara longipes BDJ]